MVWLKSTTTTTTISPTSLPDMTIVTKDGPVHHHKLVLLSIVPQILPLLCDACVNSHEHITIVTQDISKDMLEKALTKACQTGAGEILAQVMGFGGDQVKESVRNKNGGSDIVSSEEMDNVGTEKGDASDSDTEVNEMDSDTDESFSDYLSEGSLDEEDRLQIKKEENHSSVLVGNQALDCDEMDVAKAEFLYDEVSIGNSKVDFNDSGIGEQETGFLFEEIVNNDLSKEKLLLGEEPQKRRRGRPRKNTHGRETKIKQTKGRPQKKVFYDSSLKNSNLEFENDDLGEERFQNLKTYTKRKKQAANFSNKLSKALNAIEINNMEKQQIKAPNSMIDCGSPSEIPKLQSPDELLQNWSFDNFDDIAQSLSNSIDGKPKMNALETTKQNYWKSYEKNEETGHVVNFQPMRTERIQNHKKIGRPIGIPRNPHKRCSEIIAQKGGETLTKLPYGWSKSTYSQNTTGARRNVVFRSPAKDLINTKLKLKQYLEEHNITHIKLSSFDFCPYNAGTLCAKEQKEQKRLNSSGKQSNDIDDSDDPDDTADPDDPVDPVGRNVAVVFQDKSSTVDTDFFDTEDCDFCDEKVSRSSMNEHLLNQHDIKIKDENVPVVDLQPIKRRRGRPRKSEAISPVLLAGSLGS